MVVQCNSLAKNVNSVEVYSPSCCSKPVSIFVEHSCSSPYIIMRFQTLNKDSKASLKQLNFLLILHCEKNFFLILGYKDIY